MVREGRPQEGKGGSRHGSLVGKWRGASHVHKPARQAMRLPRGPVRVPLHGPHSTSQPGPLDTQSCTVVVPTKCPLSSAAGLSLEQYPKP